MRPPRFRFPDDVRSATRIISSRMSEEGTVAASPADLDEWLSRNPELQERLVSGGYGTDFTADDLYPLLIVFMGGAPASSTTPLATSTASKSRWIVLALLALAVLVITFALLA